MKKRQDRTNEFQSIGQGIREMLNSYHLSSRFDEAALIASWERLAGKPIARLTRRIFIRDKVLFVELDSPSMKHEFSLHKKQVLDLLEKEFGAGLITDIRIL